MQDTFTIQDFNAKYPTDDSCLAEIFKNRYGSKEVCPECKGTFKFYRVTGRKCYACQWCGYQLHPLADTIFHKSDTPLTKWFFAIFLFANSKNGVAATELQRQLGVTYKTAWRMARQIRLLFTQSNTPLDGTVEVDETFVGGGRKGKGRGFNLEKKTTVLGVVERGGDVRTSVIPSRWGSIVTPFIEQHVDKSSIVYTDDWGAYKRRLPKLGYLHASVKHGRKEYVRGDIHTNTIEGFWSQMKRSINGTYHAVSPKYLRHYVDEFAWRYSNRAASSLFRPMISRAGRRV